MNVFIQFNISFDSKLYFNLQKVSNETFLKNAQPNANDSVICFYLIRDYFKK